MDLRQIRYFIQVAKLRSFSKASVVLNISQPALSKQVRQLEDELGAKLMHRTTRGVSLTAPGEVLLKHGEKLIQQAQRLNDRISQAALTPTGEVSVAFPPSLARVARRLMSRCSDKYPQVQLHLIEGLSIFLEEWLVLGRIDMAVMTGTTVREGFMLSRIGREKFYLVGHADAPWANRSAITLAEVAKLDLVTTRGFRSMIDQSIAGSGQELRYRYEVDSISLIRELLLEANYATLLPSIVIGQGGFEGLATVDVVEPALTREIVLAINPVSQANLAQRSVRTTLEAELRSILADVISID